MPGREYDNGSGYRYGFNGKEDDKDISGGGQDYGMRIYDARLGRFLSVDPLTEKYPFYSTYQFGSNSPIIAIDVDGLESSVTINLNEYQVHEFNPKESWRRITAQRNGKTAEERANPDIYFARVSEDAAQSTRGFLKGLAVLGAVAFDIFVTKGWATRIVLAYGVVNSLHDNRAADPVEQSKWDDQAKEALGNLMLGLGGEYSAKIISSAFKPSSWLFGTKDLGEMGEESLSYYHDTYKPTTAFRTGLGPRFADGIPQESTVSTAGEMFESKVSFQKNSSRIMKQIEKDAELLKSGKVQSITWVFFKNPNTGSFGAAPEVINALKNAGIKIETQTIPREIINKRIATLIKNWSN